MQERTCARARIFVPCSKDSEVFPKGSFEDPRRHFKHFVHEGAEFKMPNVNLA